MLHQEAQLGACIIVTENRFSRRCVLPAYDYHADAEQQQVKAGGENIEQYFKLHGDLFEAI